MTKLTVPLALVFLVTFPTCTRAPLTATPASVTRTMSVWPVDTFDRERVTRRPSRIRVVQSADEPPGWALITTSSGPRLPSPAVRVGEAPPGAVTRRTTPAAVTEGFVRVAKTELPSTHQTHIRPPG